MSLFKELSETLSLLTIPFCLTQKYYFLCDLILLCSFTQVLFVYTKRSVGTKSGVCRVYPRWRFYKDSKLNMVPLQNFCLWHTLPPQTPKCLVFHMKSGLARSSVYIFILSLPYVGIFGVGKMVNLVNMPDIQTSAKFI